MEEKSWLDEGLEFWNKKEYEQAVECFLAGDKAGDADCTEFLGRCYYWGDGVEIDLHKAAFYHEKAAKAGIPAAMFDTALSYERGQGVQQDIKRAIFWLEKAVDEKYAEACLELGNIYSWGLYGIEKDLNKSLKYYQQGAELGELRSKTCVADAYFEGKLIKKDLEKAKSLYQEAFDSYYEKAVIDNDRVAQFWLGNKYNDGEPLLDIALDYNLAAEWYLKAAMQDHEDAQNNLGIMYQHGLGVAQDHKQAFEWHMKAAVRNNVVAMSNVGNCYYNGKGVEQDYSKAAEYHSKAAHLGYANSQEVLGIMYQHGLGVAQNYVKATYWLDKSCKNENRSAFALLGDCYRKGQGVEKDEKKAFGLYQQGAGMGDLRSKVSMAECLIEGWGTKGDDEQAFKILYAICHEEENYRKKLVTVTSYDNEKGVTYYEDPFNEDNLKHYAKAYYLLGLLTYSIKETDGSNKTEALALLRMAKKIGFKDERDDELKLEKLIAKIEEECQNIIGENRCFIEIRDLGKHGKMGRYDIYVHHADGTASNIEFGTRRRKFLYLLLLLIVSNKDSMQALMARYFCYARERLTSLARISLLDRYGESGKWIDTFTYEATYKGDKGEWSYAYNNHIYSNELRKSFEHFAKVCDKDELNLFTIRTSRGGRDSLASIALQPEQIMVPDSLVKYTRNLPSREFMLNYSSLPGRAADYNTAKSRRPEKFESWDEES